MNIIKSLFLNLDSKHKIKLLEKENRELKNELNKWKFRYEYLKKEYLNN